MTRLIDIEVVKHVETAKAILVSDTGDKDSAVWLLLSQIEVDEKRGSETVTITIPEWLALDKGLL